MFGLLVAAVAGYGVYNYWQKHKTAPAVTPVAFAQTQNAIAMSLAQDKAAGARVDGVNSQQLAIAFMRGNITEVTNAIAYLKSLGANFTAQAFISRATQLMTPPAH